MTAADWGVLIGGAALIVWINWYFFFSDKGSVSAELGAGGVVEVPIVVKGGYAPSVVRVPAGGRTFLDFTRPGLAASSASEISRVNTG